MRLTKFLCAVALCAPLMLGSVGCGEEEAGQMASDDALADYGKEASKGTALEGISMGGGEKKSE